MCYFRLEALVHWHASCNKGWRVYLAPNISTLKLVWIKETVYLHSEHSTPYGTTDIQLIPLPRRICFRPPSWRKYVLPSLRTQLRKLHIARHLFWYRSRRTSQTLEFVSVGLSISFGTSTSRSWATNHLSGNDAPTASTISVYVPILGTCGLLVSIRLLSLSIV